MYLAKDPETMQSRGFAFVSFLQKADAEAAMKALQGYGYDHLILKLEWAKPSVVSGESWVDQLPPCLSSPPNLSVTLQDTSLVACCRCCISPRLPLALVPSPSPSCHASPDAHGQPNPRTRLDRKGTVRVTA